MRREEDEQVVMLETLGGIYASGYSVDWGRLFAQKRQCVSLPTYPWQRERFWLRNVGETREERPDNFFSQRQKGESKHPLLGEYVKLPVSQGLHFWEMQLKVESFPYLRDHCVYGMIVVPGAAYLEMAFAAAGEIFGEGNYALQAVSFQKALFLQEKGSQILQILLTQESEHRASFQIFSQSPKARPLRRRPCMPQALSWQEKAP